MFLKLLISTFLSLTGIMRNKKYQKYEHLLCVYLISTDIIITTGLMTGVYSATSANHKTVLLAIFFSVTCGAVLQYTTKVKSTTVLRLIDRLEGKIPNFVRQEVNAESESQTERKFGKWVALYISSLTWCVVVSPMFYLLSKPQIEFDDQDLQVIPFFYFCIWSSKTVEQYAILIIFECIICATIVFAYWTLTFVIVYMANNIQAHAKEANSLFKDALNRNVKIYMDHKADYQCGSYVLKSKSDQWRNEYNESMYAELVKLMEYHQFIDGYVKDFERFMRIPFSSILAWFISTNVLFCYSLLQIKGDALFVVKSVSYSIHDTVSMYLYCRAAQITNELNETLQDSFYCSRWYYLTPELRKYLLTILLLCQKKYVNKGFNMYVINMNLLLKSLRIVYSVLNLLYMIKNK